MRGATGEATGGEGAGDPFASGAGELDPEGDSVAAAGDRDRSNPEGGFVAPAGDRDRGEVAGPGDSSACGRSEVAGPDESDVGQSGE